MPTYEYRCSDCTNSFEIVQKFSDPSLTTCPDCDGNLRKQTERFARCLFFVR